MLWWGRPQPSSVKKDLYCFGWFFCNSQPNCLTYLPFILSVSLTPRLSHWIQISSWSPLGPPCTFVFAVLRLVVRLHIKLKCFFVLFFLNGPFLSCMICKCDRNLRVLDRLQTTHWSIIHSPALLNFIERLTSITHCVLISTELDTRGRSIGQEKVLKCRYYAGSY